MAKKVLVFGEIRQGELRNVSFEAIAAAKQISDGGEVVGLLLGNDVNNLANAMIQYGADRVVIAQHNNLESYTSDAYSQVILQVIQSESPEGFILDHTSIGKDISPRIAAKLKSGLISDAISLEVNGDQIVFTRPIYSGKAFEKKIITDGIVFTTIRPNNIQPLEKDESRFGEVTVVNVDI